MSTLSVALQEPTPAALRVPAVVPVLPTSGVTWGELVSEAGGDLRRLAADLRQAGPGGRAATVDALDAYAAVVAALADLWRALWASAPVPVPARDLHALLGPRAGGTRCSGLDSGRPSAVATTLRTAAVTLRSAADLLATHRHPDGRPRSPDAGLLLDPVETLAAAGVLADVVLEAVSCAGSLSKYARSHRIAAAQVRRLLRDPGALRAAAERCRRARPAGPARLAALGLAQPPLRAAPPVAQLVDRVQRLRHHAWRLSEAPYVSTTTLADLAACATDLNGYAQEAGWHTSTLPAWRTLRRHLAELRTTTPPSAAVRGDVVLVRRLLAGGVEPAAARQAVEAAVAGLPQLAHWGAVAFARLAEDRIFVPARALRGEETTDHPDRAVAKLQGRLAVAPHARLAVVAAAYRWAAAAT